MDFLAVAQMPSRWARSPLRILFRRGLRFPRAWHAVSQHQAEPIALCGYRYTRELHRTWNQTTVVRKCPKCQDLVSEAEHRQLLRGPLWASPWAPEDAGPGMTTGHDATADSGATHGNRATHRKGIAIASGHDSRSGNAAAYGQVTVNGHVTTDGRVTASAHGVPGSGPPPRPASETPAAPWVGRPIRRNGLLPSDVVQL